MSVRNLQTPGRVEHKTSDNEQIADPALITRIYESGLRQVSLSLGGFFGQDMALESVLSLDLARACQFEALFCRAVGFYFWHSVYFLFLLTFRRLGRKYDTHSLAFKLRKLIYLAVIFELLCKFQ